MKSKIVKEKEPETGLGRTNYIILIIAALLIIAGYLLMSGDASTLTAYNPDIFSRLRICVAPLLCVLGYLLNVLGILKISKKNIFKRT
ncbi:DUF3098 domain-containing protein [Bacteroides sp. UBA939]|uniref:DUF3098 domain-containing protein n=1 Tax=Bacteroides sp. UBA939 TaxID=1946092 RepID=UPI0025C6858C|nr:DUF3098 domain-containing protein [Bacteroides sp. UBA939]